MGGPSRPFNLVRGTLIYGVGEVLNRLVMFLLLPVFTSYLAPADFGIISILGALGFLLASVFSLGLGAGVAPCYFDSDGRDRRDATIWTTFVILLASVGLLTVLGLAFARQISQLSFQTPAHHGLVVLSVLTTGLSILAIPFRQYLQFEERPRAYVWLSALSTLVSVVLSILMVVVLERGIRGMVEAGLLGQALTLAIFTVPGLLQTRPRVSRAVGSELLRLGLPLVPAFGSLFVLQHNGKYVLQWMDELGAVGIYTIGLNIGLVVSVVGSGFQSAWIPYFMSFAGRREEARIVFGRVMTYYVFSFGAVSLLLFVIAKPVVMILTQPAFHEAWKVVGLSAATQFLNGVFLVLLPGMYFAREVGYVGLVQGAAAVIGIALNLLLVRLFGLLGAGFALVLSYLALVSLQFAWNRWRGYLDVRYEWDRLGRFGLLYIGYMGLTWWDRHLSLLAEVALSSGAAAGLLWLVYLQLRESERQAMWSFARDLVVKTPIGEIAET